MTAHSNGPLDIIGAGWVAMLSLAALVHDLHHHAPCHVPRLRRPSVIGTQIDVPMSEVFV